MKTCLIFGASPEATIPNDLSAEGALVLCADGGLDLARKIGIEPHLVIGDFDSVASETQGTWETCRLPAEKDDTDLMAAVRYGLNAGCTDFRILGALGGRLDHAYGNLCILLYLAEQGVKGALEDRDVVVRAVSAGNCLELDGSIGDTVSVFSFGTEQCTLSYTGLQYPLEHGTLHASYPMGVSNVMIAERAVITVEDGKAVIFRYKK